MRYFLVCVTFSLCRYVASVNQALRVCDFATAFRVRKYFGTFEKRAGSLKFDISRGIEWSSSSAFIFASTSSDQFSHASSEHFVILRQLESLFIKTLFCAK